jgi:hypothetical protein
LEQIWIKWKRKRIIYKKDNKIQRHWQTKH